MTDKRGGVREWRLYVVAIVAGVYVLAWSRIARDTPNDAQRSVSQPRTTWIDELPLDRRPVVSPPAGWRVAERAEVSAPVPRRVPAAAAPRIRTRSS